MGFSARVNRKIRRVLLQKFGESIFDNSLVQRLVGITKDGSSVIDTFKNLKVEYTYGSDIGTSIFLINYFEDQEIEFFFNGLSRESKPVILDIGANIGIHAIRWATGNPAAQIFSFEPSPSTREILSRNIARNGVESQIKIQSQALSDKEGVATFFQCDDNAFNSLRDTGRKQITSTTEVQLTTLDRFVEEQQFDHITLIKIDVEGFEAQVVSGAMETFRRFKPDLFIEIQPVNSSEVAPEVIIQSICELGYEPYVMVHGKPLPYKTIDKDQYNYYFTAAAA